jgi:diguanylate cyclase (GGDEF)-like protein
MVLGQVGLYSMFALLQHAEVLLGFIDAQASFWLTAYYLLGSIGFYFLIRTGMSTRLAGDPALVTWQIVHGIIAMTWAYAITGPARGAVLAIVVLVLTYGMFAVSVVMARKLALFAFIILAGTMLLMSQIEPFRYPFAVEAIHLVFFVVVLMGVSALSMRMGSMREKLFLQKRELTASMEQIRLLATQDDLTGLANRRHMAVLVKAEQDRQKRNGTPMSLALLDLDHFKRVNDTYGHHAGDIVLTSFVNAAREGLRGADVLSRWGGEEFLLMLPDTSTDEAECCIERIRSGVNGISFGAISPELRITFSAGLTVSRQVDTLDTTTERADHALYAAKARGRNCTVVEC